MNPQEMIFALTSMHFLLDYPLQGDFIGKFKNRHIVNQTGVPWYHLMTAHAFIHGGGVFILTGSVLLGLIETILHFGIDVLKCENKTSIHTDQIMHILCKVIYVYILVLNGWIK